MNFPAIFNGEQDVHSKKTVQYNNCLVHFKSVNDNVVSAEIEWGEWIARGNDRDFIRDKNKAGLHVELSNESVKKIFEAYTFLNHPM